MRIAQSGKNAFAEISLKKLISVRAEQELSYLYSKWPSRVELKYSANLDLSPESRLRTCSIRSTVEWNPGD